MPSPRVSVLLPCRDAAATLNAALASLARQTFTDFEVVAVDDGSLDATPAALAAWARRDRRVRVIPAARRGIVPALSLAAARASGGLLARMDADDVARPERLAIQVTWLDRHPELAGGGTGVRYVPRSRLREGSRRYERWVNGVVSPDDVERDLFVECPIPHPTLILRRDAFETVGGYRDAGWPEDYDLVLRLLAAGARLGKVPDVLLEWRESAGRLSRTSPRYGAEAFRRCKAHYLEALRLRGRPVVVWGAGPTGKTFARALRDAGRPVIAFVDLDPRKIGQTIHDAPVVAPSGVGRFRHAYVVAAVGQPGAREEIRAALAAAGFREPEDCCAVA